MPSRLIHYVIAEWLQDDFHFQNKNRFFSGSICPDLSSHEDGTKKITHFTRFTKKDKGPDWNAFVLEYGDKMRKDEFYIGIFCHIITDSVWFHDLVHPLIRTQYEKQEDRAKAFETSYADFHRLNYFFSKEFSLVYHMRKEEKLDYEGLHLEWYDYFLNEMRGDIEEEPVATSDELEIYYYESARQCMKKCYAICKREIQAFSKREMLGDAREFFVPIV